MHIEERAKRLAESVDSKYRSWESSYGFRIPRESREFEIVQLIIRAFGEAPKESDGITGLSADFMEVDAENTRLKRALEKIRDCAVGHSDKVVCLAVIGECKRIATEALEATTKLNKE